jgi:hypothetical protein
VTTARDFSNLMSALMSDIIEGNVSPEIANAVCNAGGKMLIVVRMEHKYASKAAGGEKAPLALADKPKEREG